MRRIFKVRWWIPPVLTVLLGLTWAALQWRHEELALSTEKSTGLAAVATGPLHQFVHGSERRHFDASALNSPGVQSGGVISDTVALPLTPASSHRLSTFSIDVDTASYTLVRRWLNERATLPPPHLVRVEEMLNYFTYRYPDPAGAEPVTITTEVARCPWQPEHRLLRVGMKSKPVALGQQPPAHLTFLVDVSGSMQEATKLPLVQRSVAMLVEQLRPEDTVALVVYAGAAGTVLPPTPGTNRQVILDAVERLSAGGSTAGGEGIQRAYAMAHSMFRQGANNRVILATDGDFNVGVSSEEELVKLIESERDRGIFLTVLGYGMDNIQDGKLEKLADHGNGHYAYVDSLLEARRVLVEEMGATLQTVAKDVKVQVEFDPALVRSYRLVGYDNRRLTDEEFRDDRKDAGDLGAGHSVTALYELVPVNGGAGLAREAFTVRIRYKSPESAQSVELAWSGTAETTNPSADFRFASAVAEFGEALAGSKSAATLPSAFSRASAAVASGDQRREEFVALARLAVKISSNAAPQER